MPKAPHDAVRRSYDAVASAYADRFDDELARKPLDRALLRALIDEVEGIVAGDPASGPAPIADLGCGPGHVAAFLHGEGALALGIDLSPLMVAEARRRHPGVEYRLGDFLALPADDGEFAAVVAFYSIIHLSRDELHQALAEMRRTLRRGGLLLCSFHIGSETVHRDEWLGQTVDVDFHLLEVGEVVDLVEEAGFSSRARLERVAYPDEVDTRRAYLLARAD